MKQGWRSSELHRRVRAGSVSYALWSGPFLKPQPSRITSRQASRAAFRALPRAGCDDGPEKPETSNKENQTPKVRKLNAIEASETDEEAIQAKIEKRTRAAKSTISKERNVKSECT